ncbi:biotin-dependent carboxyltransferase family protein [Heyndrickxia sp. NPDC080065]|uniref:5-oxoprolinase subunit C family protein n=1 Tax=Heyndrickxia sp. NPDC080065 TaxID=3390568 RepID=UPI003D014A57
MGIKVLKGGLLSTIQDSGRQGFQEYGFVVGGAMDTWAMKLANLLLGNHPNEGVIEMTMIGATFEFDTDTTICMCGADMKPTINDISVQNGQSIFVKKGDVLTFKNTAKGCRIYLAISGGFACEQVLNSKSTYINADIGKRIEAGDYVSINQPNKISTIKQRLDPNLFSYINDKTIRYTEGRHAHWFSNNLEGNEYKISSESNRMGYRLTGQPIRTNVKNEVITEGTVFGTIQVPPNGQPIVLMADRQPTGGYPKIGEVITADFPKLAQCKPGDTIRFKKVTLREAQQIYRENSKTINILQKLLKMKG